MNILKTQRFYKCGFGTLRPGELILQWPCKRRYCQAESFDANKISDLSVDLLSNESFLALHSILMSGERAKAWELSIFPFAIVDVLRFFSFFLCP